MSSNIEVKLDVLNQKASPALYAAPLADRPAASFTGRLFVDSDSPSTGIYRDTGSLWVQVADLGAGTTGTLQQVTTNGSSTNVGINITANGLTSNLITVQANGLSDTTHYIGQGMAGNDFWQIFGTGTSTDNGEMVFLVGDNGQPYASAGERFRFSYDASSSGTAKDVLIVDYNLSYFNTSLGINTATPSADLDVHSSVNVIGQFNQLISTNNSLISFQNNSVGLWRIGNYYNTGLNDFGIFDVTNSINRITVKNTGQTFIGTDTTSSGLLVVNSSTSDNHLVCIGANAPSIRLRNTGTTPTLNIGLGISTATNNFIQSSAIGDYCIFNSSTTASPILFGIYNAGASQTQEVARISAAQNFLIGTTSDGFKLNVNGTGKFISSAFGVNLVLDSSSGGANASFRSVGTEYGTIGSELGYYGSGSATNLSLAANSSKSLILGSNGTKVLTLDSTGGATFTGTLTGINATLNGSGYGSNGVTATGANAGNGFYGTGGGSGGAGVYGISNDASGYGGFFTNSTGGYALKTTTGKVNFSNIPTSSAGLSSGDIYRTANVLNIVP